MKSLKELAQQALDVQNASNLCGVAQSFAKAMLDLSKHCDNTTDRNTHPIVIVWLDKMNSLAKIQSFEDRYINERISEAYTYCLNLTKE